jgi:antibiotic biosynthesis monooxygenase (ABM) superfamily enzyme
MALVTWVALLPMVVGLAYIFAPLRLTFLVEAALSTAIPVAMLTWIVMPRLTRLLYRWLYPGEGQ